MALTDKQIQALVPQAKKFKISDGDGLQPVVTPNGNKYWCPKSHSAPTPWCRSNSPANVGRRRATGRRRTSPTSADMLSKNFIQ